MGYLSIFERNLVGLAVLACSKIPTDDDQLVQFRFFIETVWIVRMA